MSIKISQNSRENICAKVSFLIKFNLFKKDTQTKVFPVNIGKFLKTRFWQNTSEGLLLQFLTTCHNYTFDFTCLVPLAINKLKRLLKNSHQIFKQIQLKEFYLGVSIKRCSENMQQTYRRTSIPKCDFNYWNHTSAWAFSCKLASYFQNTFPVSLTAVNDSVLPDTFT